jgi:hypothetical protein
LAVRERIRVALYFCIIKKERRNSFYYIGFWCQKFCQAALPGRTFDTRIYIGKPFARRWSAEYTFYSNALLQSYLQLISNDYFKKDKFWCIVNYVWVYRGNMLGHKIKKCTYEDAGELLWNVKK